MKKHTLFIASVVSLLFSACSTTTYFQVYDITPSEKLKVKDNNIVFEDENCRISYNLWGNGGNIGFQFFNKTEKNIYLNLEESFFILNDISYNYYKNRIYTSSSNVGLSTSSGLSTTGYSNNFNSNNFSEATAIGVNANLGYAISYNEEKIKCIPALTSKTVSEYAINKALYRDCDLLRYPSKKGVKTKTFNKNDSPLRFSNRIAYTIEKSDKLIQIENEFYANGIANLPRSEIIGSEFYKFCDQESSMPSSYFKNSSPTKFYIKYLKGQNAWKH